MGYSYTLSAFADEISADLNEQITTLKQDSIRHIEFRGVWNKNVLDLSDEEVERVRESLHANNFGLSAIGSPIGKVKISDDFEQHKQRFARALELAKIFETPNIRVFSFFVPEGQAAEHRDEVMRRMSALASMAEGAGLTMLHENERDIYGDTPERCLDMIETIGSPALKVAFDPANFVQCGVQPFDRAYPMLKDHIVHMHIKDAVFADRSVRPAGEGDGQIRAILQDLFSDGYHGFLTLEPHLQVAGRFGGSTGAELFHIAVAALQKVLADIEAEIGAPEHKG